ncbi:MAG: 3-phosphoshikimate 1-carboxyvinyltransferase [Elusimicrobia bacterium]|nr:3-phosphoshikimate 1-carboxyvinyltransferase [Elusimicrobiota bacterium]
MEKNPDKTYTPPPDKSITIRALLLGAIAEGRVNIKNPLLCEDTSATLSCLKTLGVKFHISKKQITVEGRGLKGLTPPMRPLNAGESGATMRLMAGLLAGQGFDSVITGRDSLLKRPMARVTEPLSAMGAGISSRGGRPPLKITGSPLAGTRLILSAPSAQVKSAALIAGLYAAGRTSVTERFKTRDHTERLLKHFGAKIKVIGLKTILKPGPLKAGRIKIPGDISSAAPFLAAACLLKGSKHIIKDTGLNPGRLGFIQALSAMGANIGLTVKTSNPEPAGDIFIWGSALKGIRIKPARIPAMIDEIPLLALVATQAEGTTVLPGLGELRFKESDRVQSTLALLKAFGLKAEIKKDALTIRGPQKIIGGKPVDTFNDHRIAMAAAVGSLLAEKPVKIKNAGCVKKSYPAFFSDFKKVFL